MWATKEDVVAKEGAYLDNVIEGKQNNNLVFFL